MSQPTHPVATFPIVAPSKIQEKEKRLTTTQDSWVAHDVVVGLLGGIGFGWFAGMFVQTRWWDTPWVQAIGAALGALAFVYALRWSHRENAKLVNPLAVVIWVLGLLGIAMVAGVFTALRNMS